MIVRKGGHSVGAFGACCAAVRAWTTGDLELIGEVAERIWASAERARAEAITLHDLRDTRLLQDLGATLVPEDEPQGIYDDVLDAAIALTEADAGTVHIVEGDGSWLELLAAKGFQAGMTEHFARVSAAPAAADGIALASGTRTFVDFDDPGIADVESSGGTSMPAIDRPSRPRS